MDLTWQSQALVPFLAFTFSFLTVTSPRPANDDVWGVLHVTDPCVPSVVTDILPSQTPSAHAIARHLTRHIEFLRERADDLQKQYCKQRSYPDFCREAEQLVSHYFKPSELVATSSEVTHQITKRAQDAFSLLVFLHMQLGISIVRESQVAESRSLADEFTQLQTLATSLRCYIKRYLEAQGKQVTLGVKPNIHMLPSTDEAQILADILTLEQLKHLLFSLYRDFRHVHPHSHS